MKVGRFGTHVIQNPNPAKTYSFVGTVPNDLRDKIYSSEVDAENAFIAWMLSLDEETQNLYVQDLRADIFGKFIVEKDT